MVNDNMELVLKMFFSTLLSNLIYPDNSISVRRSFENNSAGSKRFSRPLKSNRIIIFLQLDGMAQRLRV